jgi:hypothetical protein
MTSVVDFRARFTEFDAVSDPRVQLFLDDAALIMSDTAKWLEFYDVAHAYHAAHLLVVGTVQEQGDSGTLAPVKDQEVDDVVIRNAIGDISPTADDLYSTSYGKRYISYRRRCGIGFIVGI